MQILADFGQKRVHPGDRLDVGDAVLVDARRSLVRPHPAPSLLQHITAVELVVQGSEFPIQRLFRCTGELVL